MTQYCMNYVCVAFALESVVPSFFSFIFPFCLVSNLFSHYSIPTSFHWEFRHLLLLCEFGTVPILTKCSLADTQKYMKAHSALSGPHSADPTDCHLIRLCGNVGNYRLCWLRLVYFCFTLRELSIVTYVRTCTHTDAHAHTRTSSSLSWCGWQLLWNCLYFWQENHKFFNPNISFQCFRQRETPLIKYQ